MMLKIILLVLMIGFASAVDVELNCPDEVFAGEEFECLVGVSDGDGVYGVKIDLDRERVSILEFWSGKSWKSGWYYYYDFVESGNEAALKLRVSEAGNHEGVLKLKQGDDLDLFDIEIRVKEAREVVEESENKVEEEVVEEKVEERVEEVVEVVEEKVEEKVEVRTIVLEKKKEVIALGGNVVAEDEGWDYVSKEGQVVDWLPYAFCLFLILLVGLMMRGR